MYDRICNNNQTRNSIQKMRNNVLHLFIVLALALVSEGLMAQTSYRYFSMGREWNGWTSRLSWTTDLVDWAMVSPNIGLDIDLLDPERLNGQSIYLGLRSGADSQYRLIRNEFDGTDFSMLAAQLQYRWHFNFHRHPELLKGRFFVGPYFEASTEWKRSNGGLVFGYDRPFLSFGNRHFLDLQLGTNLGVNLNPRMVGEIHLALAYRTMGIRQKYWQPNTLVYRRNSANNREAIAALDTLSEHLEKEPLVIEVGSAYGDSLLAQPVTLEMVRNAFVRQYKSRYLLASQIVELEENTPLPIHYPSEHNNVEYQLNLQPEEYDGQTEVRSFVLPFAVRIYGYDQAMSRMANFNRCLREARNQNEKRLPALYMEALDSEQLASAPTLDQIVGLLNNQWREDWLTIDNITGFYVRRNGEFEPVQLSEMNRRGTYAVGLRFHPQVSESYDSLATRFNILPSIADRDQMMHDRFVEVHSTKSFYVPHTWRNGAEGQPTLHQVIAALEAEGMTGYTEDQVQLPDSIHYGRNIGTTTYGNVLQPLQFVFVVEDSVGMRQGTRVLEALNAGVDQRRAQWQARFKGNEPYGPLLEGRYGDDGILEVADRRALLDAISGYLANIDPALSDYYIDEACVVDYQATGQHTLQKGKGNPENSVWTVLQFRYRLLYMDGQSRIATAQVAYRIRRPKVSE